MIGCQRSCIKSRCGARGGGHVIIIIDLRISFPIAFHIRIHIHAAAHIHLPIAISREGICLQSHLQ